ncbi:hypothetical protein SBI_07363 [Streptomyces bingchenggensis BCW-1]|uniref:Uncharacterized protein n=1 Tax=Streptomyces bingchenggensis (strain BCW-1) TaxID=749414 RepID=D7C7C9_STRBB|nr:MULTISPECIES: hypothetical protein [Streptomyces]ADI10483.1 hypothetical protein SBI_07363 [Streptomyces bingchenggensis BCW-1]
MSVASDGPGTPLVVDGTGMLCVTFGQRVRGLLADLGVPATA